MKRLKGALYQKLQPTDTLLSGGKFKKLRKERDERYEVRGRGTVKAEGATTIEAL
jgi:hypothetical protein